MSETKRTLESVLTKIRPYWPTDALVAVDFQMIDEEFGIAVSSLYEDGKIYGYYGQKDTLIRVANEIGEVLTD